MALLIQDYSILAQTPDYSGALKVPSLQGLVSNKVVGVALLHSSPLRTDLSQTCPHCS